jgi:hypothetical protein
MTAIFRGPVTPDGKTVWYELPIVDPCHSLIYRLHRELDARLSHSDLKKRDEVPDFSGARFVPHFTISMRRGPTTISTNLPDTGAITFTEWGLFRYRSNLRVDQVYAEVLRGLHTPTS